MERRWTLSPTKSMEFTSPSCVSDRGISPTLLSMENADNPQAKRKKHAQRNSEAIRQMHAAQIYAEMLGQVCHEELYKNGEGSQEVVLILSW